MCTDIEALSRAAGAVSTSPGAQPLNRRVSWLPALRFFLFLVYIFSPNNRMAILRKCSLLALAFICCVLVAGDIESQIASQAENSTAMRSIIAPAWVSSTNFRGTSDILQSCIATLTSCVYTAVHLNVPPNDVSGWWPLLLEKLKWMTVAILLPELVVYNAVSQLLEARWLQKELKRHLHGQQTVEDMATHHGTKPVKNDFMPHLAGGIAC